MTADYPKPRDMAICETYALKPDSTPVGWNTIDFRGECWVVKRELHWLGPVLFRYEAEAGYDVFAHFVSWDLLNQFMEDYDLVVF